MSGERQAVARVAEKEIADILSELEASIPSGTVDVYKELSRKLAILKKQLENDLQVFSEISQKPDIDPSFREDVTNSLEETKKLLAKVDNGLEIVSKAILDAESRKKNFDKYLAFRNIRELLKMADVKLGQIEREAGVQPGYMSRLEKQDNSTEPTIEFLVTAAKMLKVPIDYLIKGSVAAVTETEKYILTFLDKLIEDTQDGSLPWQRETLTMLRQTLEWNAGSYYSKHPLFEVAYDQDGDAFAYYSSVFYQGETVRPISTCYDATIPESSSRIYIMNCKLESSSEDVESIPSFYEVYLVNQDRKKEIIPLFCSTRSCEAVESRLGDLIGAIKMAESHVQIDPRARSIIDNYLIDLPF